MIFRLFGLAILAGTLAVVYLFETASNLTGALRIFHWPAMVLTLVGPMALMSVCAGWKNISNTIGILFGPSAKDLQHQHEREAKLLHKLSKDYYTEGPEVFENAKSKHSSRFVNRMIDRLVTKMPIQDVRDFIELERDKVQIKCVQGLQTLGLGVRLTPSVGMLGTILGMVQLLSSLQDPAQIGSHMSLALLTTFYGLFFSLAVWTPLQQKVEQVLDAELEGYNQALRWIDYLERRKPSNYFADSVNPPGEGKNEKKDVA